MHRKKNRKNSKGKQKYKRKNKLHKLCKNA